jgi:hypothetical protein
MIEKVQRFRRQRDGAMVTFNELPEDEQVAVMAMAAPKRSQEMIYIRSNEKLTWHWHQDCQYFRKYSEREVCTACGGKGQYLMPGDAHRSEGIVPCMHCSKDGKKYVHNVHVTVAKPDKNLCDVCKMYAYRARRSA